MRKPRIAFIAVSLCLAGSLIAQEDRLERIREEIERLRDEAAVAKKEGRDDALEKIRAEIHRLEGGLAALGKGDREPEARDLQALLEKLESRAREAKEDGRFEEAEEIGRQMKKVAGRLGELKERAAGPAGADRDVARVKERLGQIERDLAEARDAGQEDRADQLLQEGKKLKAHLQKLGQKPGSPTHGDDGIEGLIDRIAKLRKEAVRARQAGALGEAKELWHEASLLEGKLQAWMEDGQPPVKKPPVNKKPVVEKPLPVEKKPAFSAEDQDLRREIERLRGEVDEMRGLLERVLAEGKRTSRTDF